MLDSPSEITGVIRPTAHSGKVPCGKLTCFFTLILAFLDLVGDPFLSGIVQIQLVQALVVAVKPFIEHVFKESFNYDRAHFIGIHLFAEIVHYRIESARFDQETFLVHKKGLYIGGRHFLTIYAPVDPVFELSSF